MRLAVNKGTQQSWHTHRFTKGIAILLPLMDSRQSTLQAQLHSYLESLDHSGLTHSVCFRIFM